MDHFYALIMAGGGGTRLWPLSRQHRPKQALPLTEERTLFQVTVQRLDGLFKPEQIFVVAGQQLADLLRESTPQIPSENFIVEPSARDSGPAVALGTLAIMQRDPEAVITMLPADHHIAHEARFRDSLRSAYDFARKDYIVTLGIHPSFPSTGFGYIQRGDLIDISGEFTVFESLRFTEKPDETTARTFLQAGTYSWNAGIFVWEGRRVLAEFERQQPEMYAIIDQIRQTPGKLSELWPNIKKISLDFAVMEGAKRIAVIPVDIGWSDVGTWSALFEILTRDEAGNAVRSSSDGHITIDTTQTLIVSERMVVTIGVSNLVIVDTDDVILVCHKDRAQEVRDVVQKLKERGEMHRL